MINLDKNERACMALSSSDRKLLIEVRNKLLEICAQLDILVIVLSQVETAVEQLISISDEVEELIKNKEKEMDNV